MTEQWGIELRARLAIVPLSGSGWQRNKSESAGPGSGSGSGSGWSQSNKTKGTNKRRLLWRLPVAASSGCLAASLGRAKGAMTAGGVKPG